MPSPSRRRALLGAGLLCAGSLLALTPMLAEREAAGLHPDPKNGGWTVGDGSFAVGTALIGASMVDMTPEAVGAGVGDGWEVCD